MSRIFVFSRQIQKLIDEGNTEIQLPEGARISAAAQDLIRAYNLEVTFVKPGSEKEPRVTEMVAGEPAAAQDGGEEAGAEASVEEPEAAAGQITEEELEAIVTRVMERFEALKGRTPSGADTGREAAKPADDDDVVICRCEEITRGQIKEAIRQGMGTLNGIKRVTRAGMGLCQGQTCERLVTQILASELGIRPGNVTPTTARAPVRPVRMSVFATG